MKRPFTHKEKTTFCTEITKETRHNESLYVQFNLSDHEIDDITEDDEMVWALMQGKPVYFFNRVNSIPTLRTSLTKIPYAFYYILKYGYTNRFVLCMETSSFFTKHYRSFADLYKRAVRTQASTATFVRLAGFFSIDPEQLPLTLTKDVFLNTPLAITMFQHYSASDAFGDFFRYEHNLLMKECRENSTSAMELADIYAHLYPFGCPNASYYTDTQRQLRAITLELVVSLAFSSIEEIKIKYPLDVTKHDPLSSSSSSILLFFIEEVDVVVHANRKILLACMADALPPVRNDDSYELFLHSLLKARLAAQPVLQKIDALWLYKLVEERIRPRLSKGSYKKRKHLTHRNVEHFTSTLFKMAKAEILVERPVLYYVTVSGSKFDNAILEQIKCARKECPTSEKKETKIEDNLLSALSTFIDRSTHGPVIPLARILYDEIRRVSAEGPPLDYWENHPAVSKDEKLQHLYQMLVCQ